MKILNGDEISFRMPIQKCEQIPNTHQSHSKPIPEVKYAHFIPTKYVELEKKNKKYKLMFNKKVHEMRKNFEST